MKKKILGAFTGRLEIYMSEKGLTSAHAFATHRTHPYRLMHCNGSLRYLACALIMLALTLHTGNHICHAQNSKQHYGISIAVLPFEVFSIEKEPTLGAEVADLIAKQLALNPAIIMVDNQQVATIMQQEDSVAITEARLRQLAKLLNANCLIMGTVTKIRNEHSIDVEMFNTASSGPNYKTYSEGLEVKSLVDTITTALDQEIQKKAERIPATERPKVSAGRQPSPQPPTGGFDVDRELLATFGPTKEDSPENSSATTEKSIPAAPDLNKEPIKDEHATDPPAHEKKNITDKQVADASAPNEESIKNKRTTDIPALNKENITDGLATDTMTDAQPSGALPDEKAIEKEEKQGKGGGNFLRGGNDPGFFSLSKAISINADTMEYDNRSNRAIFKGNVVARQDDIVMFANAMHVYYSEGGGLSRVDAEGNVRVVQGDRIATGSSIVFNNANQTIVATGDPRVWQGDNVVHGKKITVYLKEERTVVEGEPNSRASATIHPDSNKKKP
jgi:lipopolysaccharide export system protein LptA